MALQFHPFAFGLILIVAVGTAVYSVWNSRPISHQHHYGNASFEPPVQPCPTNQNNVNQETRKRKTDLRADLCTICLDKRKKEWKTLTCGHAFHPHCIDRWFLSDKTCPNCRSVES